MFVGGYGSVKGGFEFINKEAFSQEFEQPQRGEIES